MNKKKQKKNIEECPEDKAAQASAGADEQSALETEENAVAQEPQKDQLLRLQADFDNFRKRVMRERAEYFQRANEDLMLELLHVLDHFELGLKTAEQHHADKAVVDGFHMVDDQLTAVLTKFGLQTVVAEGLEFDPHQHEAMTYMPSAEHPENMIIAQTRRGYKLGGKLLRPAQVVVSSGSPENTEVGAASIEDEETDVVE